MKTKHIDSVKEAKAFMELAADYEKIVTAEGEYLCRFRVCIPWAEYERIGKLAAKAD